MKGMEGINQKKAKTVSLWVDDFCFYPDYPFYPC